MKREIFLYGLFGGVLIVMLKLLEFRFLVVDHNLEIFGGVVAAIFTGLGIYFGLKLGKDKEVVAVKEVQVISNGTFSLDQSKLNEFRITDREYEILELMAHGLSNREIGEKLFISENTVKTHSSRLFEKLNASRRTQAVSIGKKYGLIP